MGKRLTLNSRGSDGLYSISPLVVCVFIPQIHGCMLMLPRLGSLLPSPEESAILGRLRG